MIPNNNFDSFPKFSLRKYQGPSSKLQCPKCGRKSFTPYINIDTNEILDENVGICDHKNSCGYHYPPREFYRDNPQQNSLKYQLVSNKQQITNHTRNKFSFPFSDCSFSLKENEPKEAFFFGVKRTKNSLAESFISHLAEGCSDENRFLRNDENASKLRFFGGESRVVNNVSFENQKEYSTIPKEIVKNMENGFNFSTHNLQLYMVNHFGKEAFVDIQKMFRRMVVRGDWNNNTLYYQIDLNGDIRTAKIIPYDPKTGHRDKTKGANWLHSVIETRIKNGTLKTDPTLSEVLPNQTPPRIRNNCPPMLLGQVMFGLYGLKQRKDRVLSDENPLKVFIYEAEKTACFMDFLSHEKAVHLAVGGYDYLKTDMLLPLVELGVKQAILFPDKGCFEGWKTKAQRVMQEIPIELLVSDILEQTTLEGGSDIADLV